MESAVRQAVVDGIGGKKQQICEREERQWQAVVTDDVRHRGADEGGRNRQPHKSFVDVWPAAVEQRGKDESSKNRHAEDSPNDVLSMMGPRRSRSPLRSNPRLTISIVV